MTDVERELRGALDNYIVKGDTATPWVLIRKAADALSRYEELETAARELAANMYDITTNGHFVNKCVERRDVVALRNALDTLTEQPKEKTA